MVLRRILSQRTKKYKVRTWFDQPARKVRRRNARAAKAKAMFPHPVDLPLRPMVHCPTQRYNMKIRAGKGFTFSELKEAKISRQDAKRFGIAVDHRRRAAKVHHANVKRLLAYRARIVLNPTGADVQQVPRGQLMPIRKSNPKCSAIPKAE
eukprot:gnl/Trimastix_PCT/64.p2 GENE.gnl/Trimastix_PCT/64~~gnl/Trimastix_PCT/64.p2  ORF type:complete len:151 (+),score=35.71 gnl/Trimastix_PCT/64:97-549(+)